MHSQQAQYSIGALIDGAGRIAVCSEYASTINEHTRFSLSVESYMFGKESAFESLVEKLSDQLGIQDDQLDNIYVITNGIAGGQYNSRQVNMYVLGLKKPITLEIKAYDKNPISFMRLEDIEKAVAAKKLTLSFSAEFMKEFIEARSRGILREPLSGKAPQRSIVTST